MVIRAFPIRVAGNSGPLPREISWPQLSAESGGSQRLVEYTSVTGKVRRVARFDVGIVRNAIAVNAPTRIVLNHLDYIDPECARINAPTHKAMEFARWVSSGIGKPIDYVGFDRVGIFAVARRTELRVAN
jgi:adenylosuccinate synthase